MLSRMHHLYDITAQMCQKSILQVAYTTYSCCYVMYALHTGVHIFRISRNMVVEIGCSAGCLTSPTLKALTLNLPDSLLCIPTTLACPCIPCCITSIGPLVFPQSVLPLSQFLPHRLTTLPPASVNLWSSHFPLSSFRPSSFPSGGVVDIYPI